MACIYHPDHDSVAFCAKCEADLCEDCVIRVEDGRTLCHRCMLALSIEHVKSETSILIQTEEDELVGLKREWHPTYIHKILLIGALLVLVLGGLWFHLSQTEQPPQITVESRDPVEVLAGIQAALERYAVAHSNRYPDSLYDLLPGFLAVSWENQRVLRYLEYELDQREGYRLRIQADSGLPGADLVANSQDINPLSE
ncbi:MAG: hypothetical protein JSV47_06335 [Deltaproteobacteria bacterium]|nr:MAG: hypothetical protein JSV47_06335 [Deltaproteobacteria bacterium]